MPKSAMKASSVSPGAVARDYDAPAFVEGQQKLRDAAGLVELERQRVQAPWSMDIWMRLVGHEEVVADDLAVVSYLLGEVGVDDWVLFHCRLLAFEQV